MKRSFEYKMKQRRKRRREGEKVILFLGIGGAHFSSAGGDIRSRRWTRCHSLEWLCRSAWRRERDECLRSFWFSMNLPHFSSICFYTKIVCIFKVLLIIACYWCLREIYNTSKLHHRFNLIWRFEHVASVSFLLSLFLSFCPSPSFCVSSFSSLA